MIESPTFQVRTKMRDVQGKGETVTPMPTLDNVRVGSYKTSGTWEKPPTPHLSDYHNHYNNSLFHSIEGSKFRKLEGYS